MFKLQTLTIIALVGILASWALLGIFLGPTAVVETSRRPTVCLKANVAPKIYRESVSVGGREARGRLTVGLDLSLLRLGALGIENPARYNVLLKPVNDPYSIETIVDSGSTIVKDQASVNSKFSLTEEEALANIWELSVKVSSGNNNITNIGTDIIYMSFEKEEGRDVTVQPIEPAEYWHTWLSELKRTNSTIPSLEPPAELEDCGCETSWLPTNPRVQLRAQPGRGGEGPTTPWNINIRVRYEHIEATGSMYYPVVGARVDIQASRAPEPAYPAYSFQLDINGRARRLVRIPGGTSLVGASLYFKNAFFTFKQGLDTTNLSEFELPVQIIESGSTTTVDVVIPSSVGPNLARIWYEFNQMRSQGDASVGLLDVPSTDVWYPGNESQYWGNLIEIAPGDSQAPWVYAHEYGHHVMKSLMIDGLPNADGEHSFCPATPISTTMAFVEGYATAYALQVLGRGDYGGTPIAQYSCPNDYHMPTSEGRVAAGLLDLMDDDAGAPECNARNKNLGASGKCDRTVGGQLFTPRLVLRDSIVGPQIENIKDWWKRLERAHRREAGFAAGREAMEYNYYPPS
ncbi:MAG: hypothetical protein M1840_007913 [Geoglossum simile]|nr:MAG: hypothetical protein M1840_007913 [Geoglossum simile]